MACPQGVYPDYQVGEQIHRRIELFGVGSVLPAHTHNFGRQR